MARSALLASAASLLLAAPAFGQNVEDGAGKPYVMGQTGTLRYQQRDIDFRDSTAMQSIIGGYNVNRYFSVEGAYSRSRNLGQTVGEGEASVTTEMSADMVTVRALGRVPLTEIAPNGSIIGGIAYHNLSTSANVPGIHLAEKSSLRSWMIGGEIVGEHVLFRLTWEEFDLSRTKTNLISLGVGYRF